MSRKPIKSDPRHLAAVLKAEKGLELRLQHKPWKEIAEALGYADDSGAYNAVMRYMERLPAENREQFRAEEIVRLEAIRQKWAGRTGDKDGLASYMAVSDRLQRLYGIRANVEVSGIAFGAITVITGVPDPDTNGKHPAADEPANH